MWDIVHFIAHGDFVEGKGGAIVLHDKEAKTDPVPAETLAKCFYGPHSPRLVVLNCCRGAQTCASDGFRSIGQHLAFRGVPAVVAMQFDLDDEAARIFSRNFYTSLMEETTRGRVDIALGKARHALNINNAIPTSSFAAPVLHLAHGWERIFQMHTRVVRITEEEPAANETESWEDGLRDLAESLAKGNLILVAGPGLLASRGARKTDGAPETLPSIVDVAQFLAGDRASELEPEIEAARSRDEASGSTAVIRKAGTVRLQHIEGMRMQLLGDNSEVMRKQLASDLMAKYRLAKCSDLLQQIAAWPWSVLVYTHFDDLLFRYMQARNFGGRTVFIHTLHSNPGDLKEEERLMVLAAGSLTVNPEKLILTERDVETMWMRTLTLNSIG